MLRKRGSNLIKWDKNLLIMIPAYAENAQCHLTITLIPFNATDGNCNCNCSNINEISCNVLSVIGFVRNISRKLLGQLKMDKLVEEC